jgi:hypothetical protein
VTRRSIILVVCGVLTILVGIAVALLSSDQSAPASSPAVEADAATGGGADAGASAAAPADPAADAPAPNRPEVPEGTEAVAIEAAYVAGGAGFAGAGDEVNVFALVDGPPSATVAVLSNVTVLEVSGTNSGASSGGSSASTPKQVTFVLAVPVDEVEAIVRAAGFNRLYVTVPSEDSPPRATFGSADPGAGSLIEVAP